MTNFKNEKPLLQLPTLAAFFLVFSTSCTSSQTFSQAVSNPNQVEVNTSTLRLGIISVKSTKIPTGPIGWAMHQGKLLPELQKLGIKQVQTFSFPNGPNLNEALVTGQLDVGIYGDTPAIIARSNGIPIPIAEFVINFLLYHAKNVQKLHSLQADHHWLKWLELQELYNKNLLIIGTGNIGQEIAIRAKAFGMNVFGSRRHPEPLPNFDLIVGADEW